MSEVIIVNAIQTLWSQGTQPSNYLRFHETTSVSFRFKEQAKTILRFDNKIM